MFNVSQAITPRLSFAALGLAMLGGVALLGAASPANAATTTYADACHFTSTPQYEGADLDYDPCMHMRDCQIIANQAGHTIYQDGCFGISPQRVIAEAPTAHTTVRR
ncbi:hypothetical protein DWF00_12160 [Bosea caraganae]|uniref:DUF3551 domain-containing protein n=1 Tax=Bosea caraganae TaxID=2763117 RepID=A0A370LCY5_9HYPH|nr:hypothetical protein [Bosea caraganae]RDJ27677.1 hypothetical protein DWF00_12160 [Bosea caraganae]RDJ29690.1 hypothetical protein DWE98_03930 [Bosea caraganae]